MTITRETLELAAKAGELAEKIGAIAIVNFEYRYVYAYISGIARTSDIYWGAYEESTNWMEAVVLCAAEVQRTRETK